MFLLNNLNTTKYPSPLKSGAAVEIICKEAVWEMLSKQIGLSLVNNST